MEKRLSLNELKEKRVELGLADYLVGGRSVGSATLAVSVAACTAGTPCPDHGDSCPDGCLPCENWCHE